MHPGQLGYDLTTKKLPVSHQAIKTLYEASTPNIYPWYNYVHCRTTSSHFEHTAYQTGLFWWLVACEGQLSLSFG